MIWRVIAAGVATFVVAPFFVWLTNGLVILVGGQLFFLFWFLPVLFCIYKSIIK